MMQAAHGHRRPNASDAVRTRVAGRFGHMKRRDLFAHLTRHGCRFKREGGGHSIWENPASGQKTAVPRHNVVNDFTARRICKQLGVPQP